MQNIVSVSAAFLAYIDPGVGSLIFQMLIAGFVMAGFAVKVFWGKIRSFLAKPFRKRAKEEIMDSTGHDDENT